MSVSPCGSWCAAPKRGAKGDPSAIDHTRTAPASPEESGYFTFVTMTPKVCVYCGSRPGDNPAYAAAARALGQGLAARGIGLVYGGGKVGMMGALANAALAAGGEVVGIIPGALCERELAHKGLSELIVVDDMAQRKAQLADRAQALISLPGGFGTLEEISEALSWAQLDLHA